MPSSTSERLKELMRERRLKQVDIIRKTEPYCKRYMVKITKSDLSQFVSGKVLPGQWKLAILGMALDVSEGWLMGLDVPKEREKNEQTHNDVIAPEVQQLIDYCRKLSPAQAEQLLHTIRLLVGDTGQQ